jgi:hypothetical protein
MTKRSALTSVKMRASIHGHSSPFYYFLPKHPRIAKRRTGVREIYSLFLDDDIEASSHSLLFKQKRAVRTTSEHPRATGKKNKNNVLGQVSLEPVGFNCRLSSTVIFGDPVFAGGPGLYTVGHPLRFWAQFSTRAPTLTGTNFILSASLTVGGAQFETRAPRRRAMI